MTAGKEAITVRLGAMWGGDLENDFLDDNFGFQCVGDSISFWSGAI